MARIIAWKKKRRHSAHTQRTHRYNEPFLVEISLFCAHKCPQNQNQHWLRKNNGLLRGLTKAFRDQSTLNENKLDNFIDQYQNSFYKEYRVARDQLTYVLLNNPRGWQLRKIEENTFSPSSKHVVGIPVKHILNYFVGEKAYCSFAFHSWRY